MIKKIHYSYDGSQKKLATFVQNTIKDNFNTFLLEIINENKFVNFICKLTPEAFANKSCLEMLLFCNCDNNKIFNIYISILHKVNQEIVYFETKKDKVKDKIKDEHADSSDEYDSGDDYTFTVMNYYIIRDQIKEIYEYLKKSNYMPTNFQMFWLMIVSNEENMNNIVSDFQFKINAEVLEEMFDPFKSLVNDLTKLFTNTIDIVFGRNGANTTNTINILQTFFDNKIIPSDKFANNLTLLLCCSRYTYYYYNDNDEMNEQLKEIQSGDVTRYNKYNSCNVTKYYNLLQTYGYNITFDQLCMLASNCMYITNVDDYQLDLNQPKLIKIIFESKSNFYADKFKLSAEYVQLKCKERMTLAEVKRYTEFLDSNCLTNALEKNQTAVIKFIVEKGGVPLTLSHLKQVIHKKTLKSLQIYLVDKLCEQEQEKLNPVVVKDKEITKKQVKPKKQTAKPKPQKIDEDYSEDYSEDEKIEIKPKK